MELRRQAAIDRQRIRNELTLARNHEVGTGEAAHGHSRKASKMQPGLAPGLEDVEEEPALGRRFRAMGTALLGATGPRLDADRLLALATAAKPKKQQHVETMDSFLELVKRGRRKPGQRVSLLGPEDELREGASSGDMDCIVRAIDAKAPVDAASPRGVTPLMFACASPAKNAQTAIHELLERHADIARVDSSGWTCLHYACRLGRTEAMRCLLLKKADPMAQTEDKQTILMLAVLEGKLEVVREMFREKAVHATLNYPDGRGATALHYSVRLKDSRMMKLLLDYKGKPHMRDSMGRNVLSWACQHGGVEFVKVLHKRHVDIHNSDAEGKTALFYAILSEDEQTALYLLSAGADQNKQDIEGTSPKMLARELGCAEVVHSMKVIAGTAI